MMELDNCPCSGANLPRFVQPVILAVLSSGPLHGYLVVQRLAETSLFRKQPPDATGVYRMLRNMEQEGVLESDWELENSGPARKRYTLTEKGGHCLDQWMRTLTSHQAFIANLLLFLQDARSGMNSEPCPMPEHSVSLYPQEVFLPAGSPFPPASCGCGTPQPFAGAVHMNTYSFIDALKNRALRGMPVSRDEVLRLLALAPDSEEAAYLGRAARDIAHIVVGNEGRVWSAIGIDCRPCSMNCGFCAFGEKWGLITEPHEWSDEAIIKAARAFVDEGASWVTLRTTEFYGLNRLCALAKKVREAVPGNYGLVVNTGEFGPLEARAMIASGIDVVYHSLRLGEGRTTCFRPEERKATLAAVRDSDLKLAHLVEPVGPEHTDDEIADVLMAALSNGAALSGAMARINVKGTPFESHDPLPDLRLAQIVAITRICGGVNVPDICVHPPRKEALEWGANVVVVETGAVPRNDAECSAEWQGFTVADAKQLFRDAGYFVKD